MVDPLNAKKQIRGSGQTPAVQPNPSALVIAVDFGTTYSGIAWAMTGAPDSINAVKTWQAKGNSTFEKVPTEISYKNSSLIDGEVVPYEWGYKAQRDPDRIKWIKLLLDTSQNSKVDGLSYFTDQAASLIPRGKSACDVATDYLKGLYSHVHQEIRNKLGSDYLDVTPKIYVFTVPAIWSDKAKALTEKAAKAAGFSDRNGQLYVVPEPEAAALCCLKTIQPNNIRVGDNFIVVDCGGGTVDLTSYQIMKLSPAMQLREAAVGDGDLCGSVIVNTLFETLVRERLGPNAFKALKPATRHHLLTYFDESVKRAFSDDEDEEMFTVPIPGVPDNEAAGIEGGFFVLTRDDLREIFRPVMERIQKLIEGQVTAIKEKGGRVSSLLLVGGFGSSQYLLKYFREWAEDNGNFEVLQPPDAWSSIVRGAVMAGLQRDNEVIKEKLARRFYGTCVMVPFNEKIHPLKHKVWNTRRNEWYCDNVMRWFINKGDRIMEDNPIDHPLHTCLFESEWNSPWMRSSHAGLYAYDGNEAPRFSDAVGVYKVTSLETELSPVPDSAWRKQNFGAEEDTMVLNYDLRMILHGAMLTFQLRHKGKPYGTATTKFE